MPGRRRPRGGGGEVRRAGSSGASRDPSDPPDPPDPRNACAGPCVAAYHMGFGTVLGHSRKTLRHAADSAGAMVPSSGCHRPDGAALARDGGLSTPGTRMGRWMPASTVGRVAPAWPCLDRAAGIRSRARNRPRGWDAWRVPGLAWIAQPASARVACHWPCPGSRGGDRLPSLSASRPAPWRRAGVSLLPLWLSREVRVLAGDVARETPRGRHRRRTRGAARRPKATQGVRDGPKATGRSRRAKGDRAFTTGQRRQGVRDGPKAHVTGRPHRAFGLETPLNWTRPHPNPTPIRARAEQPTPVRPGRQRPRVVLDPNTQLAQRST